MKPFVICTTQLLTVAALASEPRAVIPAPPAARPVEQQAMQRVYNEVKTPYKYGVILKGEGGRSLDCPSVFRHGERWLMLYISFDGSGYDTWLAESPDLLAWKPLGKVLSRGSKGWDAEQVAGYIALQDHTWGGSYTLQQWDGKYWMSFLGGALKGYETDPLAIGMAWTREPGRAGEWERLKQPVLTRDQPDVRDWEKLTQYKSNVIYDKDRTLGWPFVMYYNGKTRSGYERIGMAVSSNMVDWLRYGKDPIVDNGSGISGDPQITRIGDVWVMFYFGAFWRPNAFDTFACSRDLVHWTKWTGPDLVAPSEPWDKQFAHKPWVLKHDGVVYHYYCAVGDQGRVIALATSSKDLKPAARVTAVPQLKAPPAPLAHVRLLDGPFKDAMKRNADYLLSLEPDRFLHTFRVTAGLPSAAKPYGGWEEPNSEVRGHSFGHYLSACALQYAADGQPAFKQRVDYIVAELAKCQAALPKQGCNPGYLSAYPEEFIDRVEALKPVWAPYYTLHKIMAGLLDSYLHCGNQQGLDVLVRFADWVQFRMDRLSPDRQQQMLRNEFGGMNEVLANLYAVTRKSEHLRLARMFDHAVIFDPLARGEDRLDGLHANTQIPKFIGAAREYEVSGETRYRDIARFAWDRVAQHRSYVMGGHSDREHFFPTNHFARHLSSETTETCNTYNMLKLSGRLFGWEPSVPVMDFYERALYNHILASQDPRTGMYVYLMPLKPGFFKTYSRPYDSFWCCVGTGMENHTRYGEYIYSHSADNLWVNLFIASELDWRERGVKVTQETRFPESDTTRLVIKAARPATFTVHLRWPSWSRQLGVKLNNKPLSVDGAPGLSYVPITREWRDGDSLEVQLAMSLRAEPLPGEPNIIALLHGPIVLAGDLGTDVIDKLDLYLKSQVDLVRTATPPAPIFVGESASVLKHIHPVPGQPMHYVTKGLARPKDVTLAPFYQLHHQRYSVYWPVLTEKALREQEEAAAAAEARRRKLEARTIDVVFPGVQQSENDHSLKGENTRYGPFQETFWRDANDGGWFSYVLKGPDGVQAALLCTYWGSDAGGRSFDVLVNGTKVASQKLEQERPGEFIEVEYALPPALRTADKLTVRFQAHPAKMAGGIFGLRLVRPSP